jgi:hypothetical protein
LPAAGLTCQCIFIVCLRKEEGSERVHAAGATAHGLRLT